MAHFAKLDENNQVTAVVVVNNDALNPLNEEQSGVEFLQSLFNDESVWVQTSYNGNLRFNFAGIGYTYDSVDDAFIAPMPDCGHDELTLNDKKQWKCTNEEHNVLS